MGQLTTGESAMESLIYSRIVKTEAGQEVLVLLNSTITPINPTVQTIQVQLALITIVALLLSLVLAVVLSQKISKPIIKTNNAAKELAQGNYEVSFEGGDYREIRELNSTLSYAASELSKVEALRKELIANISHDLRTPLTMIGGYSEMMRDTYPGENTTGKRQIILDETHPPNQPGERHAESEQASVWHPDPDSDRIQPDPGNPGDFSPVQFSDQAGRIPYCLRL